MFDERLVITPEVKANIIYDEHLIRYEFAKQFVSGKKVLDLACGSGYGAQFLAKAGAEVIAIDLDEQVIQQAKEKYSHPQVTYFVDSAEKLEKVAANSIDVVTSFETIEHLKNSENYLKALTKVLRYDGIVIISTPNREVFQQKNNFHVQEFNQAEFKQILSKYFTNIKLLKQNNCLASYIAETAQNSQFLGNNQVLISNQPAEALYFIAICSNDPNFSAKISNNVFSLNPQALERWKNNPGWKLINSIYRIFNVFLKKKK